MKLGGSKRSSNVEDRRGQRPQRGMGRGNILALLPLLKLFKGKFAIVAVIGIVLMMAMGVNPLKLLSQFGAVQSGQPQTSQQAKPLTPKQHAIKEEMARILGSTEQVWQEQFPQQLNQRYKPARLILYTGSTHMPGGKASSHYGPFYLPTNETIYIDPTFYDQLAREYNAPGDFAQAYVLSHEVGHHVQKLLGLTTKVHKQKGRIAEKEYNKLSVALELQADFLAGVWAHHAEKKGLIVIERGDIEEAMRAAKNIGDDALQKKSRGYIVEDSFTHGTSEQRMRWFMKGYRSGHLKDGNTFSVPYDEL